MYVGPKCRYVYFSLLIIILLFVSEKKILEPLK